MNIQLIINESENNHWIKIPKLNIDKKIRIIFAFCITIFMIINSFYGQSYAHYKVSCIEDRSHIITKKINNYFLNNPIYNFIIKLIFSILIDLNIIYTLIVWSIYSTNIRLLSTGISYMILNFLCRFIHIQIQPENPSFYENYAFSFFVNYKKTTYSFYPTVIGLLIICAFEWKRNNNNFYFCFFLFLFFGESFLLIALQGNYFHEVFTSAVTGHYLFIINELILSIYYGDEYLCINNMNNIINNEINIIKNDLNDNNKDNLKKKAEEIRIELIKINKK